MFGIRRLVPLLVSLLVLTFASSVLALSPKEMREAEKIGYVPGELLVKYKSSTTASVKSQINQQMRTKKARESRWGGFSVVKLEAGQDVNQVAAAYRKHSQVAWAEPNYIYQASYIPNDPLFSRQWHLYNSTNLGINVPGAWDFTMGDPSVIVAVLDTGVAYEDYDENKDGFYDYLMAPDLAGTLFTQGYDFVNGDLHPNDDDGHGTHVTGTIAQTTDNALGCAGIAPGVTIMPVKVLGPYGGTTEWVVNGIYYATYHGAKIINMSLGSYFPSAGMREACWYADNRGVTVVAAAGNAYGYYGVGYPAAYATVISVGATDYANQRTEYSDYGLPLFSDDPTDKGVDIMAPGGDTSADLDGDGYPDGVLQQTLLFDYLTWEADPLNFDYQYFNGTSMASPHVAGVAALLASIGVSKPSEIKDILKRTATDLNTAGYDEETGWGLVNAEEAVLTAVLEYYSRGPRADAGDDRMISDTDNNGIEAVTLDGSGSTWLTGFPIIFYYWKEDGRILAEGVSPTINLGIGEHVIALTCIDSVGRTDTATVKITILDGRPIMRLLGVNIQVEKRKSNGFKLVAMATVIDAANRPVKNAVVSGQWSGVVNMTAKTVRTNKKGLAKFTLKKAPPGIYNFAVTGVAKSGVVYRWDLDTKSSDTLAVY